MVFLNEEHQIRPQMGMLWKKDNDDHTQKGIALVIALVFLLVLTLIGISAISMTSFESNIAGNQRVYNLAFYTADGGIENFRGRVSAGEFLTSPLDTFSYQVSIGGNSCTVRVWRNVEGVIKDRSDASGDYAVFKVVSEGRAPFPSRGKVEIESIIEVLNTQKEGYN